MKKIKIILPFICGLIAFTGFAQEKYFTSVGDTKSHSVVELAEQDDRFSIFLSFLEASGLDTTLKYTEGFTVFMPTNKAFGEMEMKKLSELTDRDKKMELQNFVRNYILPNKVNMYEFEENQIINLEGGGKMEVNTVMNGEGVSIGGAQIIQSDIEAKDGVIHVIDRLITPTPKNMY